MRFHAVVASTAMALTLAVTPAFAAKITVSQYGRLVATLPWAVALEKGMFKQAGLDIDGITAGAGGGTSLRNMLAGELPYAEIATSAAIAGTLAGVRAQGGRVILEPHRRVDLGGQARRRYRVDQGFSSARKWHTPVPSRSPRW